MKKCAGYLLKLNYQLLNFISYSFDSLVETTYFQ